MEQLLLSKTAITVYELIVILILLIMLSKQLKRSKAVKERRSISEAKMRNAKLEEKLKNPEITSEVSRKSNPYDVKYIQNAEAGNLSQMQVAIEVHTETSVQRHLFDLDREITIGQGSSNDLVLNDDAAPIAGCCVLERECEAYIKNQSTSSRVQIKRGKKKMSIRNQMVKLQNKDILTIGNTDLLISLYKN